MKLLATIIDRHAKLILLVLFLLTCAMIPGLKKIQFINVPIENTFTKPNLLVRDVLAVKKDFSTNYRTVLISIEGQGNHTVLEPQILSSITKISSGLKTVPSIHAKSILSLSTVSDVKNANDEISTVPIIEKIPENQNDQLVLQDKIKSNDLLYGRLISKDFKTTLIIAQASEEVSYQEITDALTAIVKPHLTSDFLINIGGEPEIDHQLQVNIKKDAAIFVLIAALLIIASFYVMFKTWKGAVLLIAVMVSGIAGTMGLIGYYGEPIMILSAMLPVVIVVVGCSYAIHVFHAIVKESEGSNNFAKSLEKAFDKILIPLTISAITTFIGGISLLSFRLQMIEHFGVFLGIGTLVTYILSIFLIPALYKTMWKPIRDIEDSVEKSVLAGIHSAKALTQSIPVAGPMTSVVAETISESVRGGFRGFMAGFKSGRILERGLKSTARVVYKNPWSIIFGTTVLVAVSFYQMTKVSIGFDNLTMLPDSYPIKQVMLRLNETFNGLQSFNLAVDSGKPSGATDPEFLQRMDEFSIKARKLEGITHVFSFVDLVKKVDSTLNPTTDKNSTHIPSSKEAIAQYLFLIESSGGGQSTANLITNNHQKVKIELVSSVTDTQEIETVYYRLNDLVKEVFKGKVQTNLGGGLVTSVGVLHYIVWGKIKNILLSLLLIFLFLALIYRSFTQSLLSIATLPVGVILNFGLMGYLGIRLDMITAIITSFAMGIGVDFSIHFLSAVKKEYEKTKDLNDALEKAITGPGLAIAYNAISTKIGFSALLLSQFTSIQTFATLMCFNMFVLALGSLTFLPAIIKIARPAFVLGHAETKSERRARLERAGKFAFNTMIIAILFIGIYIVDLKAG